MRDISKLFRDYFSVKYIQILTNTPIIPKKASPSRGFSNKSKKPRKKNLIAGSIASTTNPNTTPISRKGKEFLIVLTISINYSTNIRKKTEKSKLFFNYFLLSVSQLSTLPPSTTLKIRNFCHISKYFT